MRDFTGQELAHCKKLIETLDDETLLKVTLGPFAQLVTNRGMKIRLALTDKLGMKVGSYNIVERGGGGYVDAYAAIGGNAIYSAKGEWKRTKRSKSSSKARKLKKYQINGEYHFEASKIQEGQFVGLFEFFNYLDCSRFKEIAEIERKKEHPGPHIQFVSGRGNWGAYVNGKYYPGLYSQPVKKGNRHRTLVLNLKHAKGNVPPVRFLYESNVGDKKQDHHFFRPFVNSEEIVQSIVDKYEAWKNEEFVKSVSKRFADMFAELGK